MFLNINLKIYLHIDIAFFASLNQFFIIKILKLLIDGVQLWNIHRRGYIYAKFLYAKFQQKMNPFHEKKYFPYFNNI